MRFGDLVALEDISLALAPGELVAVVGPNGAGKTTLLSLIAGLLQPTSGTITPAGLRVGWAPQQQAVYRRLTVVENLRLFARLEHDCDVEAVIERMLEQTGLADRADELVEHLSGGNRQRVNVALALLSEPPLLALDEPTAALDPAQRERLWRFLAQRAAAGTAVLFVSHNIGEVARWAGRVIVLDGGRMRFDGAPAELAEDEDVEQGLLNLLARDEAAA
jgi:ABC-type multidrug transport system ATPase subunit